MQTTIRGKIEKLTDELFKVMPDGIIVEKAENYQRLQPSTTTERQ